MDNNNQVVSLIDWINIHNPDKSFVISNQDDMFKSSSKLNLADENTRRLKETEVLFEPAVKLIENLKYKGSPKRMSYDLMYALSKRITVIAAIIFTRLNQIRQFTRPKEKSVSGLGFSIKVKDWKERKKSLTRIERKVVQTLQDFVWYTGVDKDKKRDNFEKFVMKIIQDRLRYDQIGIYKIRDRRDRLHSFKAIDGATLRFANEQSEYDFVQVIDGQAKGEFLIDDVEMIITNPDTYIRCYGYGTPELEILVQVMTSLLYAENFNKTFFSTSGAPKGILNFKGQNINQNSLEAFRRAWHAQIADASNFWKTPITAGPEIQWIPLSNSAANDIQFAGWIEYLIKVACAIYQIDPAEINLMMRNGVGQQQAGSLFQAKEFADKIQFSKDRGLIPLLELISDITNSFLAEITDDFIFVFDDLTTDSIDKRIERYKNQSNIYMTVNEIRRSEGLDDIDGGDIILNSVFYQNLQSQQMMGGEGEEETEEGGEGGEMNTENESGEENEEEMDDFSKYFQSLGSGEGKEENE